MHGSAALITFDALCVSSISLASYIQERGQLSNTDFVNRNRRILIEIRVRERLELKEWTIRNKFLLELLQVIKLIQQGFDARTTAGLLRRPES